MEKGINEQIAKCQSIDELFELWQETQNIDVDGPDKQPSIPKGAFIRDGIIDHETYANCPKKILLIAKESHQYNRKKANDLPLDTGFATFWLQRIANHDRDTTPGNFGYRIVKLANALYRNDYENVNRDITILKSVAFINLNKRGGYENCSSSVLRHYVERYAAFIDKEIELIQPQWILCCGNEVDTLLHDNLRLDKSCHIVKVSHHPSRGSDRSFLEDLHHSVSESAEQAHH